jgi:Family of unknown function (DUF6353)
MMLSGLVPHANKLKYVLNEHSGIILTAAGVGGTVATAILTGRATFKAAEVIAKEEEAAGTELRVADSPLTPLPAAQLSKTEKTKLVWRLYLPPVASGVLTIACIITANKLSSKKIAALTIAGGISERAFQEYKEKVVEKLGDRQDQKIRDEVAQDRVKATPLDSRVVIAGDGEVLCFDMLTGRYFKSTMEDIKRAENRVNYELLNHMSCSLSHFYDEIGLSPTSYTDSVGWNTNRPLEVKFSTVLSEDNRPCIAIDFTKPPMPDYEKHWD